MCSAGGNQKPNMVNMNLKALTPWNSVMWFKSFKKGGIGGLVQDELSDYGLGMSQKAVESQKKKEAAAAAALYPATSYTPSDTQGSAYDELALKQARLRAQQDGTTSTPKSLLGG